MIVMDASVLIAHLESSDIHHERASQLLIDLVAESLGASPLTIAEVLVGPARVDRLADAQAALREIGIVNIPLLEDAPGRLANLRAKTRLRLPDCCALLAAETAEAAVATLDDRLAKAAAGVGLKAIGTGNTGTAGFGTRS
jgi:predicted nucleic acid-binding protein